MGAATLVAPVAFNTIPYIIPKNTSANFRTPAGGMSGSFGILMGVAGAGVVGIPVG